MVTIFKLGFLFFLAKLTNSHCAVSKTQYYKLVSIALQGSIMGGTVEHQPRSKPNNHNTTTITRILASTMIYQKTKK